jgi:hypothetical protein
LGASTELVNVGGPQSGGLASGDPENMALSDMAIRKAKPREKPYKLADGGGL